MLAEGVAFLSSSKEFDVVRLSPFLLTFLHLCRLDSFGLVS